MKQDQRVIVFSYRKAEYAKMTLDNVQLKHVYENMFLGVIINHKLC